MKNDQNNPTDKERHDLVRYALAERKRLVDFNSLITLLGPPPEITNIAPPGSFKNLKVGIIGGGPAGLATAFELRKLGYDITIFEALEDRIGGRIYTYYFDKEKKYYGELGAMRIPVTHEVAWHYINLFKLPTRPFVQSNENAFIYAKNVRVRNDSEGKGVMEKIYPKFKLTPIERQTTWPELLDNVLNAPLLNMPPKVRSESLTLKKNYHPQIVYWDYYNIRQVLEMSGLSREAIQLISSISPFFGSFFYYGFIEAILESYPLSFTYLYEIIGGMVNLPLAFYHSLINPYPKEYRTIAAESLGRVTFHSGTWVDGIFYNKDKDKVILRYGNKNRTTDLVEEFDYVVSAIPFSTLRNVEIYPQFSNSKMEAINEVGYSNAQKTLFLCNRRFWEEQGIIGGGSFTDMSITSIWYPSDHGACKKSDPNNPNCSPFEPGVLIASYNFDQNAVRVGNMLKDNNYSFNIVKRQVEQVHGLPKDYLDNIVEDHITKNWNSHPWSLGGFSYYRPEQKRLFSYSMAVPEFNSRVFFAGEHISSTHGWANGAHQTGMMAANEIARVSKIRSSNS